TAVPNTTPYNFMPRSALQSSTCPRVGDSVLDLRRRVASALNVHESEVKVENSITDQRSAKCSGIVRGRSFFAKTLLADPYPLNVVVPWNETFPSMLESRPIEEQIQHEWNRTLELRSTVGEASIAHGLGISKEES